MTPLVSVSNLDHQIASPAGPSRFQPSAVRYIKLGRGGGWADAALADGVVPFGYREIDHGLCLAGDWAGVRKQLLAMGRTPSGASHGVRELRDFYELPDDTLWITLANGHLWWTFAEAGVVRHARVSDADGPVRSRRCRGGWSQHDLAGEPLEVRSLSSAFPYRQLSHDHLRGGMHRLSVAPDPRRPRADAYRSATVVAGAAIDDAGSDPIIGLGGFRGSGRFAVRPRRMAAGERTGRRATRRRYDPDPADHRRDRVGAGQILRQSNGV